ncbi:hypothetical protein O8W32_07500 [Methanomassiliicoccales archaeon LGM-DZ1]|nr:hypothetical protein O8W32_07500 [Methanomassiliicoccales archaeon LGM-DZ1]
MDAYNLKRGIYSLKASSIRNINQSGDRIRLELLVRESIQNSLDAADRESGPVQVDFTIGKYSPFELVPHFDSLEQAALKMTGDFLCIRDRGTTGLTGPTAMKDAEKSPEDCNFINLVKGIMDSSKHEESGGSWGIGKTIYYSLGCGMAIFYTRITTKDAFESRLIGVWINDDIRICEEKNWLGITLWGNVVEDSGISDVLPITDEREISDILDIFGLRPYEGEDTGTSIIIPSVDIGGLLRETWPEDDVEARKAWWTNSVESYIGMQIQKWYCPRMLGTKHDPPLLLPSVNGKPVILEFPTFKAVQQIYNHTFPGISGTIEDFRIESKKISIQTINKKKKLIEVGYLAWAVLTKENLISGQTFDNPYLVCGINREGIKGNRPIVLYVRQSGMFNSYDDEKFIKSIPETDENQYLIAVFRLNQNEEYPGSKYRTIEECVRDCEKSDHYYWEDKRNLEIGDLISRIRSGVIRSLKESLAGDDGDLERGRKITYGRRVAEALFPPEGFSIWQSAVPASEGGNTSRKTKNIKTEPALKIVGTEQACDCTILTVEVDMNSYQSVNIEFGVAGQGDDGSFVGEAEWKKSIGTEFPYWVLSTEILSVECGDRDNDFLRSNGVSKARSEINNTEVLVCTEHAHATIYLKIKIHRSEFAIEPIISIVGRR